MGTLLLTQGVDPGVSLDGCNLNQADLVEKVHRAYLDAGVDILETNTLVQQGPAGRASPPGQRRGD